MFISFETLSHNNQSVSKILLTQHPELILAKCLDTRWAYQDDTAEITHKS